MPNSAWKSIEKIKQKLKIWYFVDLKGASSENDIMFERKYLILWKFTAFSFILGDDLFTEDKLPSALE